MRLLTGNSFSIMPARKIITVKEFNDAMSQLFETPVAGISFDEKIAIADEYIKNISQVKSEDQIQTITSPSIKIIHQQHTFVPIEFIDENKTTDYVSIGLVSTARLRQEDELLPDAQTEIFIPYILSNLESYNEIKVEMSISIKVRENGNVSYFPIPHWSHVPITPKVFLESSPSLRILKEAVFHNYRKAIFIAVFSPLEILLPSKWSWDEIDPEIKKITPDGRDLFTFAHQYQQIVRVELTLKAGEETLSSDAMEISVFDSSRAGSWLYRRLLEDLIWLDTEKQKHKFGIEELDYSYHPFFPVMVIGMDKAKIYLQGIFNEIKYQKRLLDPHWLLLVGVYLELLTCLGIFEAVKEEFPDLITPEERLAFESFPNYKQIRKHVNIEGWRELWKLHEIIPSGKKSGSPVSIRNILKKKEAILSFLHLHHEDLKIAIKLTGENTYRFQETFQRVFRDAERAVIKNGKDIFPEILNLNQKIVHFLFWHESGAKLYGIKFLPSWLTFMYGDRDGIYTSASKEYRKSMNDVSEYAKFGGLIDYTGKECIPLESSLIHCYLKNDTNLLQALQTIDGYGTEFDPSATFQEPLIPQNTQYSQFSSRIEIENYLKHVGIFEVLLEKEIKKIAQEITYHEYQPNMRILIQGEPIISVFLIHSGVVKRYVRNERGHDIVKETFHEGQLIGIDSVVLQQPHAYTAMTDTYCTMFEIPSDLIFEIVKKRPIFLYQLAMISDKNRDKAKKSNVIKKISNVIKNFLK